MNKGEIIETALENLAAKTGVQGKWKAASNIDGRVTFTLSKSNLQLFVEVKKELRHYHLAKIFEMAEKYSSFMVIAEKIFPTTKEILREKKISYLDTAGNIFINTESNFVWIDGNKHTEEKKTATNRAFTKTGLKTVFYLLLHDGAINMPHRKLAEATDVALGNIKNVMEGLKDSGFILQVTDTKRKLQNKTVLLERWITGYRESLKPSLHIANYRFSNDDKLRNWKKLPIEKGESVWGGEPAAEHFTNYLTPAILTLYTNQNKAAILNRWKLIPDEKGNAQLYQKFWKDEQTDQTQYAPPLLVYADLLLTDDSRCQETAEMIYDQYLKNEFEN
ncbi:MAG: type IV toxin-antitoxin system AbiEi family antitoxin [Bacteroidota bacterium]|nr:type IV toxin-antitoxin system AbiEi family antitoxin [Bacteroidota bacterium]